MEERLNALTECGSQLFGTAGRTELDVEDPSAANFWMAARQARASCFMSSRGVWKKEIAAMIIQLATAKAQLNTFSPIYALPDEILARIFEILVSIYPVRWSSRERGWVSVTHVCRRFRTVAIGHAVLWSTLTLDGETPWRLFLPRSQQALLDIRGPRAYGSPKYGAQVQRIIARVRTLDVGSLAPHAFMWQPVLQNRAPGLTDLRMVVEPAEYDDDEDGHEWSTVDLRLLARNMPKLKKLDLTGVPICWRLEAPMKLSYLSIKYWNYMEHAEHSFLDMLQCLQQMPYLQYLILDTFVPSSTNRAPATRYSMPSLRLLSSIEPDERCLALWSSLDLPADCSVRIEAKHLNIEAATHWKSLVAGRLADSHCPEYRRVRFGDVDGEVPDRISFSLHSTTNDEDTEIVVQSFDQSFDTAEVSLSFAFSFVGPSQPFIDLFEVSQTGLVGIDDGPLLILRCICKVIGQFPAIETIEVRGLSAEDTFWDDKDHKLEQMFWICFLNELTPWSSGDIGASQFLPKLTTISLYNARLRHSAFYGQEDSLHDILSVAFRRRYEAGMPIWTLNIFQSEIRDSWIELWQSLVVDGVYCNSTCDVLSESAEDTDSEGSFTRL